MFVDIFPHAGALLLMLNYCQAGNVITAYGYTDAKRYLWLFGIWDACV